MSLPLFALAPFCASGLLATSEPSNANGQWTFRLIYIGGLLATEYGVRPLFRSSALPLFRAAQEEVVQVVEQHVLTT